PVDGNVERVMARLHGVEEPLPAAKPILRRQAEALTPAMRAGDYAQAVMDLGATVCLPRKPLCMLCPWREGCVAHASGTAELLPRRAPKRERPLRHGVAFWAVAPDGRVLLRRRPNRGLLGGMMEVPTGPWRDRAWPVEAAAAAAPVAADWRSLPGVVRHGFTHFELELQILSARVPVPDAALGTWCAIEDLGTQALPTLVKKVVRHALAHGPVDGSP